MDAGADGGARGRILESAYTLFSREGIHAVGVDRIVAEANVAKMTLYRHYPSKEQLVLAFLELREQRWTRGWLQREIERRAEGGRERLLAAFEVLGEWFADPSFEGCAFVKTLMETHAEEGAVRDAAIRHLASVRDLLADYARDASLTHPDEVGARVHDLMNGAIVSRGLGDQDAAARVAPLVHAAIS